MSSTEGTTPNRYLIVTVNTAHVGLEQTPVWLDWSYDKISDGGLEDVNKVELIPKTGWRLIPYQYFRADTYETSVADSSVLTPANGNVNVSTGLLEVSYQRANPELTGVTAVGQRASGYPMLRKKVGTSGSWALSDMSADMTAYPAATPTDDVVALDRVFVSKDHHEPTEGLFYTFVLSPAVGARSIGTFSKAYFSGIAGQGLVDVINAAVAGASDIYGTGQYCIALTTDGYATLYEKRKIVGGPGGTDWKVRTTFRTNAAAATTGSTFTVRVTTDALRPSANSYSGRRMYFDFGLNSATNQPALMSVAATSIQGPNWQIYDVPRVYFTSPPPSVPDKARIDLRQDVRADFQVAKSAYYSTGTLRTKNFSIGVVPFSTVTINIEWYGDIPSGTSVTASLHSAKDGTACASTGSSYGVLGGSTAFTSITGITDYYAEFKLNGGGLLTPTVSQMRMWVPITFNTDSTTPITVPRVAALSFTGPDADPTHETCSFVSHDLAATIGTLGTRSMNTVRVEVQYDQADATKTSTVFSGFVNKAKRRRMGNHSKSGRDGTTNVYPNGAWYTYSVTCAGEWAKLQSAQVGNAYDWSKNSKDLGSEDKAYKITSIVRTLFNIAGYPDAMLDIPDIDIRYFSIDGQPFYIEVYAEIAPVIVTLLRDYLGSYLVFDANASSIGSSDKGGMWRVLTPVRPPYLKPLAAFLTVAPAYTGGLGTTASLIAPGRYPDVTNGSQTTKQTFVRKGTLDSWIEPPEGNMVIVQGVQTGQTLTTKNPVKMQIPTLYNFKSARFFPDQPTAPDPTDPDYIGYPVPIYLGDAGLRTEKAVQFAARRIYDMSCHAKKWLAFEAPLVLVTQAGDSLQVRPRPLRFGDVVTFDGAVFIVGSVNFATDARTGGSRFQHAYYELFNAPSLSDYSGITTGMA